MNDEQERRLARVVAAALAVHGVSQLACSAGGKWNADRLSSAAVAVGDGIVDRIYGSPNAATSGADAR